ncbi:MAG: methanol--corrinoid methyltransferase [Clostridiales bacterium]|nr:methanol--corrinoid methyltransferase [Clostridiales bacterium]
MAHTQSILAVSDVKEFLYGRAPRPIALKNGMVIGGGAVYPELNFTLPPMNIDEGTYPAAREHYRQMTTGALTRAVELHAPGVVVEVELLPPMTLNPKWGVEVTQIIRDIMFDFEARKGLKSAMRLTPNDTREFTRPPVLRSGEYLDGMMEVFEGAARAGADFLSIESTGGKEVHDGALIDADLAQVLFALGVLGARDMDFLWRRIVAAARANGAVAAGDSACGFGNTAMVLAEKGMLPGVFAAVVRVATVARALVAFDVGAQGPSKDCAYEGPYMKAIAGVPIAMEGKSASCAHLSPVGNIAACVADMWSNESVQNIKLLADMAPTVSMEQLIYDCRLMNQAGHRDDDARLLQKWLADSDSPLSAQAYVLRPDVVLKLSAAIAAQTDPYKRSLAGARAAIAELRDAHSDGRVLLPGREVKWIDLIEAQLDEAPESERESIEAHLPILEGKFLPREYGIGV